MQRQIAEIAAGLGLIGLSTMVLPGLAPIFAYVALGCGCVAAVRAGLRPSSWSAHSFATALFLASAIVWPLAMSADVDAPAGEAELRPGDVVWSTKDCAGLLGPQELALAHLFENDRQQRRPLMHCDPVLTRVARSRAADMATRGYFAHVTPEGDGPNRHVSRAGYTLPSVYGTRRNANNVEVITAGDETAEQAWRSWLASRSHRRQVLGLDKFFADQRDYGVGYAENPHSRYETYWVLITARH